MKVEQIIDEMQASLTKLRGHFRDKGTAGEIKLKCCKCGKHYDWFAAGSYCNIGFEEYICPDCNKIKTAGERKCDIGGCEEIAHFQYRGIRCCDGHSFIIPDDDARSRVIIAPANTPDLPLHARVAEIVGLPIPKKLTIEWVKGALEECAGSHTWSISCNTESGYYEIRIADKEYSPVKGLPQAICEAIVQYSEGK